MILCTPAPKSDEMTVALWTLVRHVNRLEAEDTNSMSGMPQALGGCLRLEIETVSESMKRHALPQLFKDRTLTWQEVNPCRITCIRGEGMKNVLATIFDEEELRQTAAGCAQRPTFKLIHERKN